MNKLISIFAFFLSIAIIAFFSYLINGTLFPGTELQSMWFYSGIMMVLFSMFFVEPYYTAPTNVTASCLAATLVFISVEQELPKISYIEIAWWSGIIYALVLLFCSLIAIVSYDKNKSADSNQNRISDFLKELSVRFGSGKVIYSGIFLFFIFIYHDSNSYIIISLLVFWWVVVVSDVPRFLNELKYNVKKDVDEIGEIFGVQSKRIFLAKLYVDRAGFSKKFDIVEFCYSMQEDSKIYKGIIFDNYLLNKEKWVKILYLGDSETKAQLKKNVVYKKLRFRDPFIEKILSRFVGIIIENSQIGSIEFEFSSPVNTIQEGDLLEASIGDKRIFYQLINGITDKVLLEAKNETGFIRGQAIQLGVWNPDEYCFEKYGWVPEINTKVLKAETSFEEKQFVYPEYVLGKIPNTNLPAIINLHDAVTHHTAILGITGSGKTFIARELIKMMYDTHVICVDFTGEYALKLKELEPYFLINKDGMQKTEELFASKEDMDQKQHGPLLKIKKEIHEKLLSYVTTFITSGSKLAIFELPELSNSSFILEFTQMFLDCVFKFAKDNPKQNICIVIEEAHTVVPETSSLGDFGDYGSNKALVNKIAQIALQGRKYGVGFMILAQRTANVSKTVLTQCNTVISFQAFDKTSFDFLENYFSKELVGTLPHLKKYNAIVTGKAFKSNVPLIVDLTRPTEDDHGTTS